MHIKETNRLDCIVGALVEVVKTPFLLVGTCWGQLTKATKILNGIDKPLIDMNGECLHTKLDDLFISLDTEDKQLVMFKFISILSSIMNTNTESIETFSFIGNEAQFNLKYERGMITNVKLLSYNEIK